MKRSQTTRFWHSAAQLLSGLVQRTRSPAEATLDPQTEIQTRLLDLTHDSVFVRDMNDVVTSWNRGAQELYGWTRDEAIGSVAHELLRTVFPAPLAGISEALHRTGHWEGELVHTKRDGKQVMVASRWSLQQDRQGRPLAILETDNDITDRKQVEDALRVSEEQWKAVFENNPTMYFMANAAGTILSVNPFGAEQLGYTVDELVGQSVLNVFHEADREAVQRNVARCFEQLGRRLSWELRKVRKDGTVLWVRETSRAMLMKNRPVVLVVCEDITERKHAEERVRRSEAYLAEAQKLSLTGSFGWKVSTGDIVWSEQSFEIFGYDRAARPTVDLMLQRTHQEDVAFVRQTIDRASREATDFDFEHRLLMPDGSAKHVHVVARATRDPSGEPEFVGALMDVTAARRAAEELHQVQTALAHVTRLTTMGQLAASIAHEVNQPVAGVVTNADAALRWLAAQPPDLEEVRQALVRIIRDGNRASDVIGRIRALIKKVPPGTDLLDINETVLEAITLTRREVRRNRVSLRTRLASGLPPVRGDRIQLQQVILNLIINAIEAMGQISAGPRELQIGTGEDEANHVLVTVKDSGKGLDPAIRAHLFDAFHTTKPHGMGMGLSICRSIVEAHNGRIWAEANVPQGAVFQFALPAHRENAP